MLDQDYLKIYTVNTKVKILVKKDQEIIYDADGRITETRDDGGLVVKLVADKVPLFIKRQNFTQMLVTVAVEYKYCTCTASVAEIIDESSMSIKLLKVIDIDQRRDYFRIDAFMPVHCVPQSDHMVESLSAVLQEESAVLSKNQSIEWEDDEEYGLIITDWKERAQVRSQRVNISGGGLSFYHGSNIPEESYVLLYLFARTDKIRIIPAIARVLRCREFVFDYRTRQVFEKARMAVMSNNLYRISSQFVVIGNGAREVLTNFVSQEQVRQIQEEKKRADAALAAESGRD